MCIRDRLCIEEQFYIVAPLVLYFSSRHVRSIRMYRPWLWGLLLFIPLLRTVIWVHGTGHFFQPNAALFSSLYYGSITHCDELVMGLIISNLWVTREKPVSKFATPGILVAVAVALLIGLHQLQKEIFDFSALALLFGSLVWFGIQRRTAIFNSRIFYWISRLSFGMYLNHEYMCPWIVRAVLSRLPFAAQLPLFANLMGVVLVVTLSIAVAIVTFCGVEYPFLQIRKTVLGHHTDRPGSLESVPQRHSFGG